jgi:hypothetical protein
VPRQLPVRLSTLQHACAANVVDANPAGCPSASVVGSVTVLTPVLRQALVGPVYLVSNGDAATPGWDFSTDPDFQEQLDWMREFVREEIWPLETIWHELGLDGLTRAIAPLQERGQGAGLWAAHLRPSSAGRAWARCKLGLMHEILGTSPIAPLAFGNAAPDSGNSEILALAGTPEQKDRWLHPLLAGDLRSAFSMTEPDTPAPIPRSCARAPCATATSG